MSVPFSVAEEEGKLVYNNNNGNSNNNRKKKKSCNRMLQEPALEVFERPLGPRRLKNVSEREVK